MGRGGGGRDAEHVGRRTSSCIFADNIAKASIAAYDAALASVPEPTRTDAFGGGKQTVLAAVVARDELMDAPRVVSLGTGTKFLSAVDIEADADAFFAHDQKILLGFSCAACFLLTELMAPMHTATMKEYFHELLSNRVSVICFILWMFNIAAMVGATYLHVSTLQTIAIQTALGVLHMVVAQFETVWFPAMGYQHPPDEVAGHPDDGKSMDELFKEKLHDALKENAGRIVDLFREMDEDGDGTVNKMEFRNVDSLLGIGEIPDKIIDELFADWDPDGSGSIELDELNKLLRSDGLGAKDGL